MTFLECLQARTQLILVVWSGGGGNRTRVPKHFHARFYVRSRFISAVRLPAPNRQGAWPASRARCLAPGVPNVDPERFGISDRLLGLSDKGPQSGLPLVRQPKRSYLRQLKICGQLFTWPTDQPRHATCASSCPVESSSPPNAQKRQ